VPFETFLAEADTGDVILCVGTSAVSMAVEAASFSVYSHSAIVIKDPATQVKYLFQAVIESVAGDPLSPVSVHPGVQAGPLGDVLGWLYDGGDFPVWRRLAQWPGRDDAKVWEAARAIDGNHFPVVWKSPGEMDELATLAFVMTLWYEGRYPKKRTIDPIFCSGTVAYVLQAAGILDSSTYPPNAYEPKDFSSLYSGFAAWTTGVEWDDDVLIQMPATRR
jgi:hypothetical protein